MKALKILAILSLLIPAHALAAGSSSTLTSRETFKLISGAQVTVIEKLTIDWTADDADGSVPDLAVVLNGYLIKAITNPGATAPTDNYDVTLEDPADNALDAAGGQLGNRDTANTEQVYPVVTSGALSPVLLLGTYNVAVGGNSVNSATGRLILFIAKDL
jgi:hypothetical protein